MNMEREVQILNINDVLPNRFQPRITFDEKKIMELADSIKEHGVIQPIIVRKVADKYEIIAGERRYKASVLAGKTTIPAVITNLDDKDSAEIALIENVQRQDLTPIEEAVSYKKILDMGYLNQSELATKIGKTQSTIANKLRLLNLTDEVQEALLKQRISERHARSLLKLDKDKQNTMLNRIISERMTVKKTDEEIAKIIGSNIEVLDFGNKEEKKAMNNEINNFNIPTTPIIEPTQNNEISNNQNENSQPLYKQLEDFVIAPSDNNVDINQPINVETIPTINNQQSEIKPLEPINPGFMDVNKIEEQAVDINPNMNNIVPPLSSNDSDDSSTGNGGKFFNNVFNQEEQPKDTNTFDVNNIFSSNNNIFSNIPNNQATSNNQNVGFNPALESFGLGNNTPSYQPNQNIDQVPPINPTFDNNIQPINKSVVEMGGSGFISEEPVLQPLMNAGEPQIKHDLKEAILLIRNCSKEIEKLGFKLDVEEINFENSYQATFKIEKD